MDSLCVADAEKLELEGNFGSEAYKGAEVVVKKCESSPSDDENECAAPEMVSEFFTENYFMVKITEKGVDVANFEDPFVTRDVQLIMENIQP